jgi:putative phosphoesterase
MSAPRTITNKDFARWGQSKDFSSGEKSKGSLRIAILSDTHGFLDPSVAEVVLSCDIAVHAGDVGGKNVLQNLNPRAKIVIAIRGNNDIPGKWPKTEAKALDQIPFEAALELPGGKLVVTHGDRAGVLKKRHERLRKIYPEARLIVYGHSHRLVCDLGQIPWVVNPGSAGRARTFGGPSCLVLTANKTKWSVKPVRFVVARSQLG